MEYNMTHVIERMEVLKSIDIFRNVEIDTLYQVLKIGRYVKYLKNEVVVKKGNIGQQTFIILEGKAGVYLKNDKDLTLTMSIGSIFGELGIVSAQEADTTVKALEDSLLLEFTGNDLLTILKKSNEMSFSTLKVLIHQLRLVNEA